MARSTCLGLATSYTHACLMDARYLLRDRNTMYHFTEEETKA